MSAQKSGLITYDMTVKIDLGDRADRIPKEMRDRIPKEAKSVKELYFNEVSSYYKDGEMERPEDVDISGNGGNFRMRMRFGGGGDGNSETYKNIANNQAIDKTNLMGKDFIIKDELQEYEWKITGQKKQILNYLVMEAMTTVDDTISVTAWFAPQIPVSNGPGLFHGLPGIILELDRDNGNTRIIAKSVDLTPIEEASIEVPSKGKEVSREEFRQIRKEKMEEMREQGGGRRGIRVVRGN